MTCVASRGRPARRGSEASERDEAGFVYRRVNRLLLLVGALMAAWVVLAYDPEGPGRCWYRLRFGRDCLFCGCTRDFTAILSGDWPSQNPLSIWFFCFVVFECAWRFFGSCRVLSRRVVWTDALLHGGLALGVLVWNACVMMA